MTDPAPDTSTSPSAHLPWESIGDVDPGRAGKTGGENGAAETDLPLTPWAAQSVAPSAPEVQEPGPEEFESNEEPDADESGVEAAEPAAEIETLSPPVRNDFIHTGIPAVRSGGWTLPLLCAGIALVACCVLIPQADANHRLAYEKQILQNDLQTVERQIAVNQEFLKRVADDPTLAQRLAERQMKVVPEGSHVLELSHEPDGVTMSPFQLVSVAAPPSLPPYKPVGGALARLCYDLHSRLYLIGLSLGMIATGLVLGYAPGKD